MTTPISRFEKVTDIGFKVFSIAAICFGGVRYFQERDQIAQSDAQARSISYIEEYGSERYVAARLALHDFWTERPQLVQMLSNGGISKRVYQTALKQYVFRADADHQIREPLVLLDNLYSQIAFCHSSNLCEQNILNTFFCPIALGESVAYGPFFQRMAIATGDIDLGRDLANFSQSCANKGHSRID